jgi:hypothetical protein
LADIVDQYVNWIKITKDSITEMHGEKEHGSSLWVTDSTIYEHRIFNGHIVMIIGRSPSTFKVNFIDYLDMSFDYNDGHLVRCKIVIDKWSFLVNIWNSDGELLSSSIFSSEPNSGSYVSRDAEGVLRVYKN